MPQDANAVDDDYDDDDGDVDDDNLVYFPLKIDFIISPLLSLLPPVLCCAVLPDVLHFHEKSLMVGIISFLFYLTQNNMN